MDSETGDENNNSKKMAHQYLKGQFTVDLVATIPFDIMA